jgi:molybdate transport system permease protein
VRRGGASQHAESGNPPMRVRERSAGTTLSIPDRSIRDERKRRRHPAVTPQRLLFGVCTLAFLLLLLLPIYAIFWRSLPHGTLFATMRLPIVRDALRLSLVTTSIALLITLVCGTPVAYLLARHRFPGYTVLDSLIDLPMVLPPSVAGLGLLIALGRRGLLGDTLAHFGITLPFTPAAVVLAQCFVAAPFYIKAAKAGFLGVDKDLEEAAATFGSSGWHTFTRVTLPLAFPSVLGGIVMMWSRALGEFGATIFFAGNLQGKTQTIPLAIFQEEQASHFDTALAMSAILVAVSFLILVVVKTLTGRVATAAMPD